MTSTALGAAPMSSASLSSVIKYLGLPKDYAPSPDGQPVAFLNAHIRILPPHLLQLFSTTTTPKQRTVIPIIRNRRLKYIQSNPSELSFSTARETWSYLWRTFEVEPEKPGTQAKREGEDEKRWAETGFFDGQKTHVGKLGSLLSGYEEERGWERERAARRQQAQDNFIPEEDEDSDEEEEELPVQSHEPAETLEQAKELFERAIRERFIYGLLPEIDYDMVDWNEGLDDADDRDAEERWFDDEEAD